MASKETDAFRPLLERSRVPRDGCLIVHSAIAGLSHQGFRAEAIIDSLLNYMPRGNLFMPTMTWRAVTADNPRWDERDTPSETGVLTEIFRKQYAVARSIHPTHSAAGVGPAARLLLSRHHFDDTPVSANSPYGLLRDYETYILAIGVGLESVTAIHLPEETTYPDIYLRPREAAPYQCRDRNGVVHQVWARRHWRLDRDFNRFVPALEEKGQLHKGQIVDGYQYMLVSQRDLLRHVFKALIENPHATLSAKSQDNPGQRTAT